MVEETDWRAYNRVQDKRNADLRNKKQIEGYKVRANQYLIKQKSNARRNMANSVFGALNWSKSNVRGFHK